MVRPCSTLMALGAGIFLLGVASPSAADVEALKAHVPFTFMVGGATLPPGQYVFRFDYSELPGVLRVRTPDGREGAFVLAQNADVPEGSGEEPRLVFEKDGDRYVLSKVLDPDFRFGLRVLNPRPQGEPERPETPTD
jgi:hypothetical protein